MTGSTETGGRGQMVRGIPQVHRQYQDWTEHQVLLDADEFITKYELHDLRDILRKGALLAHDPTNASYAEGLTQDPAPTRRALQVLLFTVATGTCGSMVVGYALHDYPDSILMRRTHLVPYLAGSIITALLSRCLTSRSILLIFGATSLIRSVFEGLWTDKYSELQIFIHKSLLLGLGAVQACTAPVYLAEISEPKTRGYLILAWIGIVSMVSSMGHLLTSPTSLTLVSSVLFLATVMISWESPYPLISRGKMRHAYRSLCSFRPCDLAAARDLFRIYHQSELGGQGSRPRHPSWRRLCSIQRCRALLPSIVLLLAFVLMRFQYEAPLWGRDQIFFGTRLIFASLLRVSMFAMKRFGHRSVLVGTILLDLLIICVMGLVGLRHPPDAYVGTSMQVLWKTAMVTLAAGSFPFEHRAVGVSVMSSFFYGSILLVELLARAHVYALPNFLFGVRSMGALILVFLFTIEITDLSLEEIQAKLAMPLEKVASYRIRVELPYLFQRYFLRRDVELVPFDEYHPCFGEIALSGA